MFWDDTTYMGADATTVTRFDLMSTLKVNFGGVVSCSNHPWTAQTLFDYISKLEFCQFIVRKGHLSKRMVTMDTVGDFLQEQKGNAAI